MRITRANLISFVAGVMVASSAIAIPWTVTSHGHKDMVSAQPAVTAAPEPEYPNLAIESLPLTAVRKLMGNQELRVVNKSSDDNYSHVFYSTPDGKKVVELNIWPQTSAAFVDDLHVVQAEYRDNRDNPFYRGTEIKSWPTGQTHTVSAATGMYTMVSAKYRHHLLFATDGRYTIRVRTAPYDDLTMFMVAQAVLNRCKEF